MPTQTVTKERSILIPIFGVLLTVTGLTICILDPLSSFRQRDFKKVSIISTELGIGTSWHPITYLTKNGQVGHTTIPGVDWVALKPKETYWLMTADWYLKGPRDQLVTPLRVVKAYPWVLALLYPTYLLIGFLRRRVSSMRQAAHQK